MKSIKFCKSNWNQNENLIRTNKRAVIVDSENVHQQLKRVDKYFRTDNGTELKSLRISQKLNEIHWSQ